MYSAILTVTFISDWHVGSGMGDGAIADSILTRDADGLPYIPGRAIKGALRESAWRLGLCRPDLAGLVDPMFGTSSTEKSSNESGRISAGSACLPLALRKWLLCCDPSARSSFVGDMTILRMQTALDNRQVVPHSLRSIECGIPGLEFESSVTVNSGEKWIEEYMHNLCAGIKSIGGDRARGLGECRVKIKGMPERIKLPADPIRLEERK